MAGTAVIPSKSSEEVTEIDMFLHFLVSFCQLFRLAINVLLNGLAFVHPKLYYASLRKNLTVSSLCLVLRLNCILHHLHIVQTEKKNSDTSGNHFAIQNLF